MENNVYLIKDVYMLSCIEKKAPAHDAEHIYRVLGMANQLAECETAGVDRDVLTAACLLHDIGLPEQFKDPAVCHAEAGSRKAYAFLLDLGWREEKAAHTRDCVLTHRTRTDRKPSTIEAKLLFDADKLAVSGALGIARTLYYGGEMGCPLYSVDENGLMLFGSERTPNTFLQEYKHKLEHIGDSMHTARVKEIAARRHPATRAFYESLVAEIGESCGAAQ